jgi:hypothetical protein
VSFSVSYHYSPRPGLPFSLHQHQDVCADRGLNQVNIIDGTASELIG